MSKNINIPMVTELVAPGNPKLKARAELRNANSNNLDELNLRIDELEDAIGQDNSGPIGRAFAIRAESPAKKSGTKTKSTKIISQKPNAKNTANH